MKIATASSSELLANLNKLYCVIIQQTVFWSYFVFWTLYSCTQGFR